MHVERSLNKNKQYILRGMWLFILNIFELGPFNLKRKILLTCYQPSPILNSYQVLVREGRSYCKCYVSSQVLRAGKASTAIEIRLSGLLFTYYGL